MVLLGIRSAKYIFVEWHILRRRLVGVSWCSMSAILGTKWIWVYLLMSRKLVLRRNSIRGMHLRALRMVKSLLNRLLSERLRIYWIKQLLGRRSHLLLNVGFLWWVIRLIRLHLNKRWLHGLYRTNSLRTRFDWGDHLWTWSLNRRSLSWSFPMHLIRLVRLKFRNYIARIFP